MAMEIYRDGLPAVRSREPQRWSSSDALARAMEAGGPRVRWLCLILTDAEERLARRRALVLGYPDLAKRLTLPPVGYTRAEQWNGYLPPGTDQVKDDERVFASAGPSK